ncbi:hypothetical protein WJX84_006833 [Apatococcus fuscideae]|uniref:ABC-2 type transporter domain-containing protein n=1 Tax=Apatococcus fuscideae TaxID=2026836 RepID=A0AAW1T934_9CHLO
MQVLYREQAAGMYTAMPFALAQCCVEIPWNLVQSILFSCVSYWMINFDHSAAKFFWYLFVIFITLNILTFYGIMSVFITPDVAMASVLSGTFYGLWNLFAGFLIPVNRMPGWWVWYYYINPISWTLYGIIIFQLGDFNQTMLSTPEGSLYTLQQYLEINFDYKWHFRGQVIAILIAFMLAFMLFAIIGLRFINFQKR